MSFVFLTRTQFHFEVSPVVLSEILNSLTASSVSITAYSFDAHCEDMNVRMVVGLPGDVTNDAAWNLILQNILIQKKVSYEKKSVIDVSGVAAGLSGILRSIYNQLLANGLRVDAIYMGEDTHRFIDTNNYVKALCVLQELN